MVLYCQDRRLGVYIKVKFSTLAITGGIAGCHSNGHNLSLEDRSKVWEPAAVPVSSFFIHYNHQT